MRRRVVSTLAAAAMSVVVPVSAVAQEADISVRRDIRYTGPGQAPLLLDVYSPTGPGIRPALIVIPGGRWVEGSKEEATWLPVDLAGLGFVAFVVNYRSATEAPFPAALEDVQQAVRFVRRNADRFDIDPARIGAIGASAGGHLAALLATAGEGPTDVGARIHAAVSWSGPMDLPRLLRNDRADLVEVVRTFLGCPGGEDCVAQARAASPIAHVDPTDGAIYMGNSTEEIIPLEQATSMVDELNRSGVPNQLVETLGRSHGFGAVHNDKFFTPAVTFLGGQLGLEGISSVPESPAGSGKSGTPSPSSSGEVRDTKQPEPDRPRAASSDTPIWLVLIAAAAALAAGGSLAVTVVLVRRLRELSGGAARTGGRVGAERPGDEPEQLVGSRSDRPA